MHVPNKFTLEFFTKLLGDGFMLECHVGEIIKNSPYRRAYIMKYMEVSENTLSNWCTGKSTPSVDKLFKLASLLEVKVDDLYTYKN